MSVVGKWSSRRESPRTQREQAKSTQNQAGTCEVTAQIAVLTTALPCCPVVTLLLPLPTRLSFLSDCCVFCWWALILGRCPRKERVCLGLEKRKVEVQVKVEVIMIIIITIPLFIYPLAKCFHN